MYTVFRKYYPGLNEHEKLCSGFVTQTDTILMNNTIGAHSCLFLSVCFCLSLMLIIVTDKYYVTTVLENAFLPDQHAVCDRTLCVVRCH
jgi:hypothetical protein